MSSKPESTVIQSSNFTIPALCLQGLHAHIYAVPHFIPSIYETSASIQIAENSSPYPSDRIAYCSKLPFIFNHNHRPKSLNRLTRYFFVSFSLMIHSQKPVESVKKQAPRAICKHYFLIEILPIHEISIQKRFCQFNDFNSTFRHWP